LGAAAHGRLADGQASWSAMAPTDDILLSRVLHDGEPHELRAVLDELSLTYHVVLVRRHGDRRRLKAHAASLAQARRWAGDFIDDTRQGSR
jgi:hypothetical protein